MVAITATAIIEPFGTGAPSCLSAGAVVSGHGIVLGWTTVSWTTVGFAVVGLAVVGSRASDCSGESADCRGFTIDWVGVAWFEKAKVVGDAAAGLLD